MDVDTKSTKTLMLLLTVLIFTASIFEADARRRYNPEKTRKSAIKMIRKTSVDVSHLAGLKPMPSDSAEIQDSILQESEELTVDMPEGCPPRIGEYGEDIEELKKEDDVTVDMQKFTKMWLEFVEEAEDENFTDGGIKKSDIMNVIMDWLGTPYRFGGESRRGIDCSAFTRQVFIETSEIEIPRTARTQINIGKDIEMDDLVFGDLIFFHTYSWRFASHVGIYLGDNLFAHASSRYGVTVSSLESTYYNRRFIKGKRITVKDLIEYSIEKEEEEDKIEISSK